MYLYQVDQHVANSMKAYNVVWILHKLAIYSTHGITKSVCVRVWSDNPSTGAEGMLTHNIL